MRGGHRSGIFRAAICLTVAALTLAPGCGGSGGEAKSGGKALEQWASRWHGSAEGGRVPREFHLPPPPHVDLGSAQSVRTEVGGSADDVSELLGQASGEVKRVYCYWFGWYLDTGQALPTSDQFPAFILKYGFGRVLRAPPSQQLSGALNRFRNAIDRAQSEGEAAQNAAVAAACSVP